MIFRIALPVELRSSRQSLSIIFLLMFLPALMLLIPPSAFASRCRACPDLTPCEAYGGARAVFVGRAISGEEIVWEDSGKEWIQLVGKVRFIVEQSFKGVNGNEIEVIAGDDDCDFMPFVKGERYLLYLNRSSLEGLSADICSRSTPISNADEDLKFLSSLTSKTCGARLYGSVGYFGMIYMQDSLGLCPEKRVNIGVPGITITAKDSRGQIHTTVTDREGAYEFTGVLPDVEYTVSAELPGYIQKTEYSERYSVQKILQIGACGCGRVDFPAFYDSSISGRVTTPGGKPAAYAKIAMVRADEKVCGINTLARFDTTDKDGRFILKGLPPGHYVLGVNITVAPYGDSPYRPTWYPEAATRPAAAIIEVGPGQKLSGYDLIIPRRLAERTIEGTVIRRDGKPAAIAHVHLVSSLHSQSGHGTGGLNYIRTDKQGRFKITGYEGIDYYVVASSALRPVESYGASSMYFYSEPQLVEPKGGNVAGLRLALNWDKGTLRGFFEKKREQ